MSARPPFVSGIPIRTIMKILHVADYLPGLHKVAGGAEFAARRVIDEQSAAGIDVEVATLRVDVPGQVLPWQHYEMRNLDRYAPALAYAVKQMYFPADPLASIDLTAAIAQSRPDVVHYHNLHFSGLSVTECARAAGVPSVWSIYDYWIFCPSFMLLTKDNALCLRGHGEHCVDCVGVRRLRLLKPVKRALFGWRTATFARPVAAVDRFVVLSEASRDLLEHHGVAPERICVLPQYIWTEAAAADSPVATVPGRIIYVGWIEHRKGLHVVIEALAQVASEFPSLHLDVLGLPAHALYQAEVEKLAVERGIADRVRFRGRIGRDELVEELRRAFLVAIPEQWENMSPVILTEAMAAGACVLASRVGGIRQFVEEFRSGLLAQRDDPAEFADRMRWAMNHTGDIAAMAARARRRAKELFHPNSINTRTLALYQSLVGVRKQGAPLG